MSRFILRSAGLPIEKLSRLDFSDLDPSHEESIESSIENARRTLWASLDDPDFLDALATINPALFQRLVHKRAASEASHRNSYVRGLERTLFNMLVRFCTRNDTTGSAGLSNAGVFDESLEVSFAAEYGTARTGRHVTFTAPDFQSGFRHWLDHRFASQLRDRSGTLSDRFLHVPARYRSDGGTFVDTSTGMAVDIADDFARSVFARCAAGLSARELLEGAPDRTWECLEALIGHGHVVLRALIPEDVLNPMSELAATLRKIAWTDRDLEQIAAKFDSAEALRIESQSLPQAERAPLLTKADELLKGLRLSLATDSATLAAHIQRVVANSAFWDATILRQSEWYIGRGDSLIGLTSGAVLELGDDALAVARACDGVRTLRQISEALRIDPDSLASIVDVLFEHGVVRLQGEDSCITTARWQDEPSFVDASAALLVRLLADRAPDPDLDALRESVAGIRTRYTDETRDTVYLEDFAHDVDQMRIGGPLLATLRASTEDLLRLLAFRHFSSRQVVESPLRPGFSLPLLEFQRRWTESARYHRHANALSRVAGAQRIGGSSPTSWCHDLEIDWELTRDGVLCIRSISYPEAFTEWLRGRIITSNPDMMVLGDSLDSGSESAIVLNEAHAISRGLTPLTNQFDYLHGAPAGDDDVVALLRKIGLLLWPDPVHDKVSFGARGGMREMFFLATGGEIPTSNASRYVAASSVDVVRRGERHVVRSADREFVPFELQPFLEDVVAVGDTTGEIARDLCAALLSEPTEIQPEVRWGSLVLGRRQLWMSSEEVFADAERPAQLLSRVRELRRSKALPRYWFLRLPPHKPFMVDGENLFSLENARDFLRKSEPGSIQISAMLPPPDALWFEHKGRFTSEIRYAAALVGSDFEKAR